MGNVNDPRADAKLRDLPEEELETLWRFRHPEKGGKKLPLEKIAAEEVPLRYGVTISLSSLSGFYRWLEMWRDMRRRTEFAENLKAELARDTDLPPELIAKAGQKAFLIDGMEKKDVRVFSDMVRTLQTDKQLSQNETRLQQNDEKLRLLKEQGKRDSRRIKLLEDKAAEAKQKLQALATAAKTKGGLTPETLAAIEEAAGLL